MTTRTFNQISVVVFGLLTILLLVAACYNWAHIILAAASANLVSIALNDDSEGESLLDEIKRRKLRCLL